MSKSRGANLQFGADVRRFLYRCAYGAMALAALAMTTSCTSSRFDAPRFPSYALELQYYIVAHDSTATLLLDAALRAAQRGLHVDDHVT